MWDQRAGRVVLRLDVVAAQLSLSLITGSSPPRCQPPQPLSHPHRLQRVRTRTVDPSSSGVLTTYIIFSFRFSGFMRNNSCRIKNQGIKAPGQSVSLALNVLLTI